MLLHVNQICYLQVSVINTVDTSHEDMIVSCFLLLNQAGVPVSIQDRGVSFKVALFKM